MADFKNNSEQDLTATIQKTKSVVDKYCSADDYSLALHRSNFEQVRFAADRPTQNLSTLSHQLILEVSFSGKSASATTSALDEDSLKQLISSVEDSAKLAVEDKEFMPSLGPDQSVRKNAVAEDFFEIDLGRRGKMASKAIDTARSHQLECSGKVISAINSKAIATKNNLMSEYSESLLTYEHTMQRDREASKVRVVSSNSSEFKTEGLPEKSIDEIALVSPRKTYKTGRYPVVMSSMAANQLLPYFIFYGGDRRAADEGRSAFTGKVGTQVANPIVTLMTDTEIDNCPACPFDGDGLKGQRRYFVNEGVLTDIQCDRFWAKEKGLQPWSWHNLVMMEAEKTDQELISQVEDGFYITDIWYVRAVTMQDLTLTGMTRNALFKIKDGRLVGGSEHFRWNMSFYELFQNIREVGQSEFGSNLNRAVRFPSLLVDDFYFASTTTA